MNYTETCKCGASIALEDVQLTTIAMDAAKAWRKDHKCGGATKFDQGKFTPEAMDNYDELPIARQGRLGEVEGGIE